MFPTPAIKYLLHGLSAQPTVLEHLMRDALPDLYDARPDPERFTLREVIGHLADWEAVWLERIERMIGEETPELISYDEGQWAIDHDYAHMDVAEQLVRYRAGRDKLVAYLRGLSESDWTRDAKHSEWGVMTVFQLAALVLGHDGYHTRQVSEYVS